MLKYIPIVALSLCACSHTASVQPVAPVSTPTVITVELAGQHDAKVMRCSGELDCMQKLTGFCPNGYNGGELVRSNKDTVVGTLFLCITDEQVAAKKAQLVEWEEERARQQEQRKAFWAKQEADQKKANVTKHKK